MSKEIQEKSEDVQEIPVKVKRIMSEAQKESLTRARAKAFEYREQLKQEKERLGIKDNKKLSKTQLKLLKLKELKEQREKVEVVEVKEAVKEVNVEEVKVSKRRG